jgi:hypothetical protein
MPQKPENLAHLERAPERTLEKGLAGLERAAVELSARTLAVLVLEAASFEIVYRGQGCGGGAPASARYDPEVRDVLRNASGPVPEDTPAARFLCSALAPAASSFLVFPWAAERRAVTIVFGFAGPHPAHTSVPAHILESIHLAALAAWSLKEVNRLRAELRAANGRLAGRALVERAKGILQSERGMDEQKAYEYLRRLSRQRRISMAKLAEDLLGSARWP